MKLLKQIKQHLKTDSCSKAVGLHFSQTNEMESVILRFYKSKDEYWYVDMPEWQGSLDALEMVQGADDMLNDLSNHTGRDVYLQISTSAFDDSESLIKIQDDVVGGGAYYGYPSTYRPKIIWLCSVSNWYFGYHPENIFFKSIV
jgi:hypothetical protein